MLQYRERTEGKGIKILIAAGCIIGGLLLGFILSRILFTPSIAAGNAMNPGLHEGQRLIFFKFGSPEFGDIVLMEDPATEGKTFFKRVIGVGGDTIEIKNQVIYRNFQKLRMNWPTIHADLRNFPMGFASRDNMPMVKLARNEFFVLNDNIDDGYDSRAFGSIKDDSIIGTLLYVFK